MESGVRRTERADGKGAETGREAETSRERREEGDAKRGRDEKRGRERPDAICRRLFEEPPHEQLDGAAQRAAERAACPEERCPNERWASTVRLQSCTARQCSFWLERGVPNLMITESSYRRIHRRPQVSRNESERHRHRLALPRGEAVTAPPVSGSNLSRPREARLRDACFEDIQACAAPS